MADAVVIKNSNLARQQKKKEVVNGKMQCSKCKEWKLATNEYFSKQKNWLGLAFRCKVCDKDYYDKEDSIVRKERSRIKHLRRTYGLTQDDFNSLLEKHNKCCYICFTTDDLVIDHNHENGKIRGILCRKHNAALGMFGDSIYQLQIAIEYLQFGSAVNEDILL